METDGLQWRQNVVHEDMSAGYGGWADEMGPRPTGTRRGSFLCVSLNNLILLSFLTIVCLRYPICCLLPCFSVFGAVRPEFCVALFHAFFSVAPPRLGVDVTLVSCTLVGSRATRK